MSSYDDYKTIQQASLEGQPLGYARKLADSRSRRLRKIVSTLTFILVASVAGVGGFLYTQVDFDELARQHKTKYPKNFIVWNTLEAIGIDTFGLRHDGWSDFERTYDGWGLPMIEKQRIRHQYEEIDYTTVDVAP